MPKIPSWAWLLGGASVVAYLATRANQPASVPPPDAHVSTDTADGSSLPPASKSVVMADTQTSGATIARASIVQNDFLTQDDLAPSARPLVPSAPLAPPPPTPPAANSSNPVGTPVGLTLKTGSAPAPSGPLLPAPSSVVPATLTKNLLSVSKLPSIVYTPKPSLPLTLKSLALRGCFDGVNYVRVKR